MTLQSDSASATGSPNHGTRFVDADAVSERLRCRWSHGATLLDSMCHDALNPSGKLLRPSLLLESARAVGGLVDQVMPAAVGAESGHVASLVHDDIIDGDEMRRGRPAIHSKYGIGDAIVAGDAMLFDLFVNVTECRSLGVPADRVVDAVAVIAQTGVDLCRGQSLEAEVTRRRDFTLQPYIEVARLKTASYFRCVCMTGALLGGASYHIAAELGSYGQDLGIAFQIYDDMLSYVSSPERTGKPATSDVRNGRLTLPIILAFTRGDAADRDALAGALFGSGDDDQAISTITNLIAKTEAVAGAAAMATDYATAAISHLDDVRESSSRAALKALAEQVVGRDR